MKASRFPCPHSIVVNIRPWGELMIGECVACKSTVTVAASKAAVSI